MILTNNLALCDWYKSNSQNVKSRFYCKCPTDGNGNPNCPNANDVPNNNENNACTTAGGTWTTVPAFGIPPPDCVAAPFQRDNHLGNGASGFEIMANLTIPSGAGGLDPLTGLASDEAAACVYRLRYNITTADTRVC